MKHRWLADAKSMNQSAKYFIVTVVVLTCVNVWLFLNGHQSDTSPSNMKNTQQPSSLTEDSLVEIDSLNRRIDTLENALALESQHRQRLERRIRSTRIKTYDKTNNNIPAARADTTAAPQSLIANHDAANSTKSIDQEMIAAGIDSETAEAIHRFIGKQRLALLNMRDRAIREQWMNSERYFDNLDMLSDTRRKIRAKFGDEIYDRYLYASGFDNRVEIVDVYPQSVAEEFGLHVGDVILSYDGQNVYSMSDLKQATSSGDVGKPVLIRYARGNQVLFSTIPRGPIGIEMDSISTAGGPSR